MARRNGPLLVFGNPRKRGGYASESAAWEQVLRFATTLESMPGGMTGHTAKAHGVSLRLLATDMLESLREGVHINPREGIKIGKHVQAIAYVHAKDNGKYVHGFGNAHLNENELKAGVLRLDDLKDKTDVEMIGSADKRTITIRGTKGQPLHDLFAEV